MNGQQQNLVTNQSIHSKKKLALVLVLIFLAMILVGTWRGDFVETYLNGKTL